MAISVKKMYFVSVVLVLLPALCYSAEEYESSKATCYGSPYYYGFPMDSCGYGMYGKIVNKGNVASVSRLFKNGTGCGVCYQIKCKAPECSNEGIKVVATDNGYSYDADFILSPKVYGRMAQSGKETELLTGEIVDIEYKRIPCSYPGKNLMVKVHERSFYPNYLALVPLYQGGTSDITGLEIYEETTKQWKPCRRMYGAVWDIVSPPKGALTLRFYATESGNSQGKWVLASNVIPANWKAGVTFGTSVQLR